MYGSVYGMSDIITQYIGFLFNLMHLPCSAFPFFKVFYYYLFCVFYRYVNILG